MTHTGNAYADRARVQSPLPGEVAHEVGAGGHGSRFRQRAGVEVVVPAATSRDAPPIRQMATPNARRAPHVQEHAHVLHLRRRRRTSRRPYTRMHIDTRAPHSDTCTRPHTRMHIAMREPVTAAARGAWRWAAARRGTATERGWSLRPTPQRQPSRPERRSSPDKRHITSRHFTSDPITSITPHQSHHITSHHATSHHITPHQATSHHNTAHHNKPHHNTSSYHAASRHITSRHITTPHHTTPHHTTPHHTTPHHTTPHHTQYHISHHIT